MKHIIALWLVIYGPSGHLVTVQVATYAGATECANVARAAPAWLRKGIAGYAFCTDERGA